MFNQLATRLFPHPLHQVNAFRLIFRLLRSWYKDGIYDVRNLEDCLKANLGGNARLFSNTRSLIATKVGVTAATIDKAHPVVITNYNGLPDVHEHRQSALALWKSKAYLVQIIDV